MKILLSFRPEQHKKGQEGSGDAYGLSDGKNPRDGPTARISPVKFDDESSAGIEKEIIPEEFPGKKLRSAHRYKSKKDSEGGCRFINLGWMEGDAQRGEAVFVGKGAGPRSRRWRPIAASCRKAAQPAHGLADGDGRSDQVG